MRDRATAAQFFSAYQDAYDRFSAPSVAKFYVLPALICDTSGQRVAQTRASLEREIVSQFDRLTALGYQSSSFTLTRFQSLGPAGSQVTINWTLDTGGGTSDFGSFYLCCWTERDDAWRIACTYAWPYDHQ